MKKTYRFNYSHPVKDETGKWTNRTEVLERTVTDHCEPRDCWKKVVAADYFTAVIRERYGARRCVHTREIEEIGG